MKKQLNPINQQTAVVALRELPTRLHANTEHSYLFRGSEGKSMRAQAKQNLRWNQLFQQINRRGQA